jgi:hypothetical protein
MLFLLLRFKILFKYLQMYVFHNYVLLLYLNKDIKMLLFNETLTNYN